MLSLAACRLPQGQTFARDPQVSVGLPTQPRVVDPPTLRRLTHAERLKTWVLGTLGGAYQLMRAVNPARHVSQQDTLGQQAYCRRIVAALGKHQALLISARACRVGGSWGRDIPYKRYATAQPKVIYARSFVLGSVGYPLRFIPAFQDPSSLLSSLSTKQRRLFFNSIKVTPSLWR